MLHIVDSTRREQLAWLEAIRKETGWNWSDLARAASLTPQLFSKFRNDPENKAVLDTRTVEKIAAVSPVPHYRNKRGTMPEGFDEDETSPYEPGRDPLLDAAVKAILAGNRNLTAWILRTAALDNAGYRAGDVLLVDATAAAREGDVVCAQIFDQRGGAETAFRLYHKPFLVAASSAARFLAPRMIDARVELRGVVVSSLRGRPATS